MFKVLILGAIAGLAIAEYGVPAADPAPAYEPAADTVSAPAYGVASDPVPTSGYAAVQPATVYYQPQILPVLPARHDLLFPRRHHHHHSSSSSEEHRHRSCRKPTITCKNSNCKNLEANRNGNDEVTFKCECQYSSCNGLILVSGDNQYLGSTTYNSITYTATCGRHGKWRKDGKSFKNVQCIVL